MPARHRSRQRALQVLFLWDIRKPKIDEAITSFYETLASDEDEPQRTPPDEFMETLVRGVSERSGEIDQRISAKSQHWRIERMAAVSLNIPPLATFQLSHLNTPAPTSIIPP